MPHKPLHPLLKRLNSLPYPPRIHRIYPQFLPSTSHPTDPHPTHLRLSLRNSLPKRQSIEEELLPHAFDFPPFGLQEGFHFRKLAELQLQFLQLQVHGCGDLGCELAFGVGS